MRKMLLLLGLLVVPAACWSQGGARAEILVLGTYHMANPGRDLHNIAADDVLAPRRQREIAQLIEVLKRFHPTKIAIEAEVGSRRVAQQYADYLAGKYQLTRNEDDQIGFRLAKELGHAAIYPVDEEGDFPYGRVANYAKAKGRADELAALQAGIGARVQEHAEFLKSHTVFEMLELMNSDAAVAADVAGYFEFVPYGDPDDYAGPDLLAMWYQRNIRIYGNIVALIDSPNERILVIYGAGHLGWLRQDAANDASVRLRRLADFTR
jgi:Family of unknown function (DUF5694)